MVVTSLLVSVAFATAAPPEVPEKVEAKPGELTRFVVKAEKGKKVAFAPAFDEGDCFVDRLFSDESDTTRFLVQPRKAGVYVITFWTVGEGTYKQVRIKAGDPVPPPPPPPPPGPVDPFVVAIKAAIAAEPVANRPLATRLADVYAFGATRVNEKSGDGQAFLADTWGALFEAMAGKANELGVAGKLPATNAAVAPEVRRLFPVQDVDPIDAAGRAKAAVEFARVARAIREAAQ